MRECPHCNIKIIGETKKCPFCQNLLVGEATENNWPSPKALKSKSVLYKIQLFIVLTIMVLALSVDFLLPMTNNGNPEMLAFLDNGKHWSIILCMWLIALEYALGRLFKKHFSAARILSIFVLVVCVLVLITFKYLELRVGIVDYNYVTSKVIPVVIMGTMIANFTLAMINSQISNSLIYLLSNIIIGILPYIVLVAMGKGIPELWLALLVLSIILFIAACVFRGRAVLSELRKRFNM